MHGDVMRAPYGEAQRTFERLVALDTDDCLIWPYSANNWGYGQLTIDGRVWNVHRLALVRRVGEPPAPKLHAAHYPSCTSRACLNFRHLRWASCAENHADKKLKFAA